MPTELMETYCEGGVWDPFSVEISGHDILFSVQYSFEHIHDAPIFKTYRLSLANKSVVAASLPTAAAPLAVQTNNSDISRNLPGFITAFGRRRNSDNLQALHSELINAWEMDKVGECSGWHSTSLVERNTERVHQ